MEDVGHARVRSAPPPSEPPWSRPSIGTEPLGPRRVDAVVVLALRLLTHSWLTIFGVGLVIVALTIGFDQAAATKLDTPQDWFAALVTPLVGVALAIGIRLVGGMLGTAAAVPRAVLQLRTERPVPWVSVRAPGDLYYYAVALRRVRATSIVRDRAASGLGPLGIVVVAIDRVLTWTGPLSVATAVVVALVVVQ